MALPSQKETYDSDTPSDLSLAGRTSVKGALYRRSPKGTNIQSYRGSTSNSSVHTTSTAATRKDLFDCSEQGPGGVPSISDRKSFHSLEKPTFRSRNQSQSTVGTVGEALSVRSSTATSISKLEICSLDIASFEDEDESSLPSTPRSSTYSLSTLPEPGPSSSPIYGVTLSTPLGDPLTKLYGHSQPFATTEIPTADEPSRHPSSLTPPTDLMGTTLPSHTVPSSKEVTSSVSGTVTNHKVYDTSSSAPSSRRTPLHRSSSSAIRSDNRSPRPTFQTEPYPSHSYHFPHLRRHTSLDFDFPRPSDEEIEALFQIVIRTRDLSNLPPLTIDQKWSMVECDERLRFNEEKARKKQAKKVPEQRRSGMIEEKSPEWYLVKFMDRTITPNDASGLLVSLRGHELGWFQQFVAIRGTRVLSQYISYLSSKGEQRTEADHQLEYETLRCIKQIFNSWNATRDAINRRLFVVQIASSFNSPRLPAKKLVAELLTFLAYRIPEALSLITEALEAVTKANNAGNSPYTYWFASFEKSISRRGKTGSLVGASDEVRKNATTESNINEYALSNLLLINGILANTEDLDLRIHHASQMATAGLRRIMDLCRSFNFESLNTHLDTLQETIENDEKELRERLDQELPRDLTNIEDVYAALKTRTRNTKAYDHLLSILQHLLLIREDGPGLVQYYQLLDSLVTDVVMDHKLSGAEQRLGKSVESIISQFNDADQFRVLEAEAAQMRADLRRLQLEKETLESEMLNGGDGLE